MPELTDGVKLSIAQARLALEKPRPKRRKDLPEDDAFTREEIEEARS